MRRDHATTLWHWTAAVTVVTSLACSRIDWAHRHAIEAPVARRLVGVWTTRFTLDPRLARDRSTPVVTGTIALVQDHFGRVGSAQLSAPLHYGVYDIDFRPFGFDPRNAGSVPSAIASAWRAPSKHDSVRVVLDPGANQMEITLDGELTGDSVTGSWLVSSRFASGGGQFAMHRMRDSLAAR